MRGRGLDPLAGGECLLSRPRRTRRSLLEQNRIHERRIGRRRLVAAPALGAAPSRLACYRGFNSWSAVLQRSDGPGALRTLLVPAHRHVPAGDRAGDRRVPPGHQQRDLRLAARRRRLAAGYHWLLYSGFVPKDLQPCGQGPSCAEVDLRLAGFLTIPLMSLLAFSLILLLLAAAWARRESAHP